jgi:hypothetical protein
VLDVERERIHHAPPADRAWPRALRDIAARIQERDARAAHQPLQRSADEVVDPGDMHVEREGADRLVGVDDEHRPPPVADLRERANVLDPAGREVHVAGAHRARAVVHRALEELERDADAVGAAHELDARATIGDRVERVTVGREVEVRDDDLRPLRVVEGARDPDEPGRDVRLDRDLVAPRAEDSG